jgi:hypothetical protein
MLALAASAAARPADTRQPALHNGPAPTIVKETVVEPDNGGLDTITLVWIGVGAAAALFGAGYLGARVALRTSRTSLARATSAESSMTTLRGQASRTGM